MQADRDNVTIALHKAVTTAADRIIALQRIAGLIKNIGNYRWVALYDVDHEAGRVTNIVWSGPSAPEHPTFPSTKGLTATAIFSRQTVSVGDVAADARYLTAFGTTKSEIIVPAFDRTGDRVIGTIDVESEMPCAFNEGVRTFLETCSKITQPLWDR